MKNYLEKISDGKTFTIDEAYLIMKDICSLTKNISQVSAFLALLHNRGETKEEIVGFANYFRQQSVKINIDKIDAINTSGTGGDRSGTFNISTASALLLASHGVNIIKHGGRAVSSQCGSIDVVEALGIPLCQSSADVTNSLKQHNCAFLYAPTFNPAFKNITSLRRELGIRTCFNLLGPLLNPANIKRQIVGVYSKKLLVPIAETLNLLGIEEAMVIHSQDGMDEFSIFAPTDVAHLKSGNICCYQINPENFSLLHSNHESIRGGNAKENAKIIKEIFSGGKSAKRDIILLNSAAGFILSGNASSLEEGIAIAKECIDSGKTSHFLNQLTREISYEK